MEYIALPDQYTGIDAKELLIEKARGFYEVIERMEFNAFIAAFQGVDSDEVIIYETEPVVNQNPKNDIRYVERLYVRFDSSDTYIPEVYSLRPDFPEVPHLMVSNTEFPRQLCIYELSYNELKLNWRSKVFIEDIRNWLTLTARNELHQANQPCWGMKVG